MRNVMPYTREYKIWHQCQLEVVRNSRGSVCLIGVCLHVHVCNICILLIVTVWNAASLEHCEVSWISC